MVIFPAGQHDCRTSIIIVPCYNEADRLDGKAFLRFTSENPDVRLLLVNDGSRDSTLDRLHELRRARPSQFDVLDLARNGGKAEAVRQGVLHAASHKPVYIGFWDADLATPLDEIPRFVSVLQRRNDIAAVMGARLPLAGHTIERRLARRILGRAFARVASLTLGARLYDTQCGAKVFRATSDVLGAFAEPFHSRWIFDVELLARWKHSHRARGAKAGSGFVYELPVDSWQDVAGSKLKRGDFVKAIRELAAIWWRYLRPGAPTYRPEFESQKPAIEVRRAA